MKPIRVSQEGLCTHCEVCQVLAPQDRKFAESNDCDLLKVCRFRITCVPCDLDSYMLAVIESDVPACIGVM